MISRKRVRLGQIARRVEQRTRRQRLEAVAVPILAIAAVKTKQTRRLRFSASAHGPTIALRGRWVKFGNYAIEKLSLVARVAFKKS